MGEIIKFPRRNQIRVRSAMRKVRKAWDGPWPSTIAVLVLLISLILLFF